MIELPQIAAIGAVAFVAWIVWSTLKARETANAAMRRACELRRLYFLDDTVSLESVRPVRDDEGRMRLRWTYRFQYSDTGHNRRNGSIALVGNRVVDLDVVPPDDGVVPLHQGSVNKL
ncbi:MAG TPA: DUF3301 domain-containing protein [Casimicrobiaceae bacterium]|nr:DUF3301 domain-containing protein [Casimicrobiaceae bacterium]